MILNLPTIANKRIVSNPDGSQILELGESVIQYKKNAVVEDIIIVTADQAGKPWVIAQALYLKESAIGVFFYLNGYPNPYAIQEGDKLLKFSDDTLNTVLVDNNLITKEFYGVKPGQKKNTKLNKIDQNRQAVLKKTNKAPALAPNESTAPSFIASDGLITLGTDVSDSRCKSDNLSETQTRTEQIRAAIKKKLGVSK